MIRRERLIIRDNHASSKKQSRYSLKSPEHFSSFISTQTAKNEFSLRVLLK